MQIVNFSLMKNPLNWLTVILMLYLAAIAGTLILEGLGIRPATGAENQDEGTFGTITGASSATAGAIVTGGDFTHATFSQNPTPGLQSDLAVTYW